MAYHISTRCQHLEGQNKEEHYGAISYPIYPSSAFIHQEVGGKNPYDYSRLQDPTRAHCPVLRNCGIGLYYGAFSSGRPYYN